MGVLWIKFDGETLCTCNHRLHFSYKKSEHRFTRMKITKSHKNIDKSEKLNNEKYEKIERKE